MAAFLALALTVLLCLTASPALAVPTLQLYIEGSTYDATTESWVFTGDQFKVWVLGSSGPIYDVKLTVAFPAGLDPGNILMAPTTATVGLLPAPGDTSTPGAATIVLSPSSAANASSPCGANGTVGTIPCQGDGTPLPQHGEFGAGIQWVEFALGNFTLTDSPIGDFIDTFPGTFPAMGQINAYQVTVNSDPDVAFPAGTVLHFDAFDHIVQRNGGTRVVFAPFSHDAIDQPQVAEPSSLLLLVAGGGALAALCRRRRRPS